MAADSLEACNILAQKEEFHIINNDISGASFKYRLLTAYLHISFISPAKSSPAVEPIFKNLVYCIEARDNEENVIMTISQALVVQPAQHACKNRPAQDSLHHTME
eukprot:scaffold59613_cov59-Attheya_sp.AAC.3